MNRNTFLRLLGAGAVSVVVSGVTAGAALAATKAIPGVGIRVHKKPGGNSKRIKTTTGADGTFRFAGLAPGSYDVIIGNAAPLILEVGSNGVLAGKVLKNGAGPAFIEQANSAN